MEEKNNYKTMLTKIDSKKYMLFFIKTPIAVVVINIIILLLVFYISKNFYIGQYEEVVGRINCSIVDGYQIVVCQNEIPTFAEGIWYCNNSNVRYDCRLYAVEGDVLYYDVNEADVNYEALQENNEVIVEMKVSEITLFDYFFKGKRDERY